MSWLTRRSFLKFVSVGASISALDSACDPFSLQVSSMVQNPNSFPLPRDGRMRITDPVPDRSISQLMHVDARGGTVISIPDFNLSEPGAKWDVNDLQMVYEPIKGTGYGCYRLVSLKPTKGYERNQTAISHGWFDSKPNRMYVVSVLINCDFVRTAEERTEINIGGLTPDPVLPKQNSEQPYIAAYWNGIPNQTKGWIRWEWEFPSISFGKSMQFYMLIFQFLRHRQFRIADVKFIELPPKPLKSYAQGEGVTFRGGPGKLPMQVFPAKQNGSKLEVSTTGVRYIFDKTANTIVAEQLLEKHRPITIWNSSLPLKSLRVLKQSSTVCVLVCDGVTFGVQCDGMMMVAPQRELALTCTSQIGGKWNRLFAGHLISLDDWGGMTVNPDITIGSGRVARMKPLTPGLDFVGVANNVNFLSQAQPGWQVRWEVSPGERLAISVFPPRPYDWKTSFDFRPFLDAWDAELTDYAKWPRGLFTCSIPWGWNIQGYGQSYSSRYIPWNEEKVRAQIAALKAAGIKVCNYFSAQFYWSRDAQEFVDEVKRWKDQYGIEGMYSDGNPSQEWVLAYEQIRMLRELFPDGLVMLHSTGQVDGGGTPLALPDIFLPFVDTYCTATLRGESVVCRNLNAPYHRYVTSQYRKANCIGMEKGDRWEGVSLEEQDKVMLLYNGRIFVNAFDPDRRSEFTFYRNIYYPWLMKLKRLWEEKGKEPNFFEKYYLPVVKQITGYLLGR